MRFYTAGPYAPKNCSLHDAARIAQRNTNIAIDTGIALMRKGHSVYIPHLTHYIHLRIPDDLATYDWYTADLEWLRLCNALYLLPGWQDSTGAKLELAEARRLEYPVYLRLEDVPEASRGTKP